MLAALVTHMRAIKPDVVLCFQHYGNLIGGVAARLAGVPVVIANRNTPRLVVPWWTEPFDVVLGVAGLFNTIVVNSGAVEQEYRTHPAPYRARIRRIDHGFLPKVTQLDVNQARAALGLPHDKPLLGSAARLHPVKNLAAAIRLLPENPDWHLALAGQGKQRDELVNLAEALGVRGRLHLLGELSPERMAVLLRALDVFVFPSLDETFGLAVVEAAQAGVAVVCNDLPVLREVLSIDGKPCALFVDVADTENFARKVGEILHDRDLRMTLTARGRQLAGKYSLDEMAAQYVMLMDSAAKAPRYQHG
jgi:glycosyltransferase involved in cell wall biosynthesis